MSPILRRGVQPSFGHEAETNALQYYLERTAQYASKFAARTFWVYRLPQMSWVYPALKQCLIALAVADHARFQDDDFGCSGGDHLASYYKAIHLLRSSGASSDDVYDLQFMLVASSALWNVDLLNGRPSLAMVHLKAGQGLFEHLTAQNHSDTVLLQEVRSQYQALSVLAYGDANFPFNADDFDVSLIDVDALFPLKRFLTLLEAQNSLRRVIWGVFVGQRVQDKPEGSLMDSTEMMIEFPFLSKSTPADLTGSCNIVDRWLYRLSISSDVIPQRERDVLEMHIILAKVALEHRDQALSICEQENTEHVLLMIYHHLQILYNRR